MRLPNRSAAASSWIATIRRGLVLVCAAAFVWFVINDVIESRSFAGWVRKVRDEARSPDEQGLALAMMKSVFQRLNTERRLPDGDSEGGLSMKSSMEQLHNPSGACASYSHVLAKCLMTAGIQVRKVGLEHGGHKAIHHVIEARLDGRWVLMDPLYNLVFRNQQGALVDAVQVREHWDFFKKQLPPNYNPDFDYAAFYHTNWDRVPLLGGMIKAIPGLVPELERQGVSVRFWFFNSYRWWAALCVIAGLAIWWSGRWMALTREQAIERV